MKTDKDSCKSLKLIFFAFAIWRKQAQPSEIGLLALRNLGMRLVYTPLYRRLYLAVAFYFFTYVAINSELFHIFNLNW